MEKLEVLQTELQELVIARQKLETQFQENKIVQDEFKAIKGNNKPIYKLTGGVLLPVEYEEASVNVDKRLEFITTEIEKCEQNIKTKQTEMQKTKSEAIASKQ
ncbi:Prefoldin subunit 6 [Hanseniaspora osmophila]|uniref:Prefoldin subunit 6 n=1 Tax=Hanseniaspora osmophila TaxID=56408 RepID=A0A1E5RB97_9ASCO|nr:Prefoldin subunit 6 [Hanseniaspora osmophila]